MGSDDAAFRTAVTPVIDGLTQLADAYNKAAGSLPTVDSKGMRELHEQARFVSTASSQPVDNAHSVAKMLTFAGFDHLRNYAQLLDSAVTPVYSHLVVARAALQAFGLGYWLSDPNIGVEARIKRGFALEIVDAQNRSRYGLQEVKDKGKEIIREIRMLERELGWKVFVNNRQIVGGEEVPTTAKTIANAIGIGAIEDPNEELDPSARAVWSYLSGVAHGYTFPLMQSVTYDGTSQPVVGGLVSGSIVTNSESASTIAMAVASAGISAGGSVLALMGWDRTEWTAAVASLRGWTRPIMAKTHTRWPKLLDA